MCPLAIDEKEVITLAHGSGGKATQALLDDIFLPAFGNALHDAAALDLSSNKIAFTTDSYVVKPVFFPGGDIGKLAITGTVNDLAMCCAKAAYISCGFIIEEGFAISDLRRIVASMKAEGIPIVAGDTKVIERQTGNNIFINTSGIGIRFVDYACNPNEIRAGDAIILSGDIGRHAMAVMTARENITYPLESDVASLLAQVEALANAGITLHCLRESSLQKHLKKSSSLKKRR